jgi:FAD/FMN-containing dehydrogenase
MTFIGDLRVEPVVNAELDALDPARDLGPFGQVALVPIRRPAISSPLLRMPADDLCYAFNLVRVPPASDASEANRLVDANKATYGRVKAAGGTLYPVSAIPMSKGEWRDHFGSAFGQLMAAKQRYDPDAILTPGYPIF